MKRFEINKTYTNGRNLDYKWTATILKRTAKTVTIKEPVTKEIVRKKIYITDNTEYIFPTGIYSMAPIVRAEYIVS